MSKIPNIAVKVQGNDLEQAMRQFKKKCNESKLFYDLKLSRHPETRGQSRKRKQLDAMNRNRRNENIEENVMSDMRPTGKIIEMNGRYDKVY